jgi:hypothetical protein
MPRKTAHRNRFTTQTGAKTIPMAAWNALQFHQHTPFVTLVAFVFSLSGQFCCTEAAQNAKLIES